MDPEEVRKKYPRESENPFDSDRKLMATKHMLNGILTMIVKGAVDVLLDRTDLIQLGDEVYEITREMTVQGLRHKTGSIQKRDFVYLLLHIKLCQMRWN